MRGGGGVKTLKIWGRDVRTQDICGGGGMKTLKIGVGGGYDGGGV